MKTISRDELKRRMDEGRVEAVVEVLDPPYYRKFHLPEAINVPLGDDFEQEIQKAVPDKSAPVVVYCQDEQCDASPKAAERMEAIGYSDVLDYEAGKVDWRDAGLPVIS